MSKALQFLFRRLQDELDDKSGGGGGTDAAAAGDQTGGTDGGQQSVAGGDHGGASAGADKGGGDSGGDQGAAGVDPAKSGVWWKDDWRVAAAGDNEKMLKRLERYSTPKDALLALDGLQHKISSGELRSKLSDKATEDQVKAWRAENGVPETADKYDLKLGDGLVVGDEDKPIIDTFLKDMHSANANNEVASKAVEWYYKEIERQTEAREQADQEAAAGAQDQLRSEWGNEYRANVNMVEGLLDLMPPESKDLFKFGRLADGTPILAHVPTIQWLNNLSRQINPVTTVVPGAGANAAQAIDDEIKAIEKDMRAPRGTPQAKAYWEDDKRQARYRDLISARERSRGSA